MTEAPLDPHAVLGVSREVSDDELRHVYRALVKRHHPDHNGGSPEASRRFAEIQRAYAAVTELRRATPVAASVSSNSRLDARIADLERELAARREAEHRQAKELRLARERAAATAAPGRPRRRPTPEELGRYSTDDSFTKIIDDAAEQLGRRLSGSEAKKQFARRLSDLFGGED